MYQVSLSLPSPSPLPCHLNFLEGFGRVSLPNVLPYPGIETVLQLQVVETAIYPYQEISHIVEVHDISRPLKATIVWMDPNNAIMTNRMLLNNLDLKVITPSGQILYGNNVAGDEVNNVSLSPAPPLSFCHP
jgi:serine protease AprX